MFFRTLAAGAVLAASILAVRPVAAAGIPDADVAVRFFEQTCLKHFADRKSLKGKLAEGAELALPEMQGGIEKYFLGGQKGRVWLLKQGETGVFALAIRDDGLCTVFARRAEEIRVLEKLDDLFARNDFFARKEMDSEHDGVVTRRYYQLTPGGNMDAGNLPRSVMDFTVSTTTETEGVGYQAALSLDLPHAPAQ